MKKGYDKYKWDKKRFISDLILLKAKLSTYKNINKEHKYDNEIELLEFEIYAVELLLGIDIEKCKYKFSTNKKRLEYNYDLIEHWFTKTQIDLIDEFSDRKRKEPEDINNFEIDNRTLDFNEQKILLQKLFGFDEKSRSMLDNIFKPNNSILKMNRRNNTENCFINLRKKYYISTQNKEDIKSFISLAHELGHCYEFLINKNKTYLNNNYFNYSETFSLFFELRAINLLFEENIINKEEKRTLFYNLYLNSASGINSYKIIKFSKNNKLNKREKYWIKNDDISNSTLYFYSYIIALSLFYESLDDFNIALGKLIYLNNNFSEEKEQEILKYCDLDLDNLVNNYDRQI